MRASAERLMVQWAKADMALAAILDGRVATDLPSDPTFPFLVVFQIGGAPDPSEAPVDLPLLQWDCYGSEGFAGRAQADTLARPLLDRLSSADGMTVLGQGHIYGHQTIDYRRSPEPDTGWARYTITTISMIRELV